MYINKIDDLIDKIIDDFYATIILKNKRIEKIKDEINFVKSQQDINDILINYIKTIPSEEIKNIVKKGDSYITIFETIQKYIIIYTFLMLGFFYKGRPDNYINNIIEFTRNQPEYPLKINNFFDSESNSLIIKLFYLCRNIITLVSKDSIKIDYIKREPYVNETMDFINNIDSEFIDKSFKLLSLDNNLSIQSHNIIKTIIVFLVYSLNDKQLLNSIIEQQELSNGEYMFIEIIEPITESINFGTIESLLNKKDLFDGLAHDIWNYIDETNRKDKQYITNDEKINILINSGLVVPILDDFLLYHQENERYDKFSNIKKKDETKIKYIIGKIDTTADLYSDITKKDSKLKETIMKNFPPSFYNRKAILRNNTEDVKIINKFINQGKRNAEVNDYFNDLITYKRYSYVNFKSFDKYGFSNYFTKTITSVRAVNFDNNSEFRQTNKNNKLQLRVGAKDSMANIVGFMIPSNIRALQCIKISEVVNIRDLNKKNKNGFNLFSNFLKKYAIKGNTHKSSIYWLFDPNFDKVKLNTVEIKDINSQQDTIRSIVAELYKEIVNAIYFEIIDKIDALNKITIDNAVNIIHYLEKSILKIPLSKDMYEEIEKYIFEKKIIEVDISKILESDTLYGFEGDVVKLPTYNYDDSGIIKTLNIDLTYISETGDIIEEEKVNGICQHNISWDNINMLRKTNYTEYMEQLYIFIQQYVVDNDKEYICKSCGFYLDIGKYVEDGVFDDEKGFITFSIPFETDLIDIPEYEKFKFSIKIMDKNIEKIASSVGIQYFIGNSLSVKWRRNSIVKNTIDMVIQNNNLLTKNIKNHNDNKTKLYGISKTISNIFNFDMENNIYQISSRDKDQEQFKIIKRNNIIIYIMIYIILELNESQISFFISDKKHLGDILIFDRIYNNLFSDLRIKKNNTDDTVFITKYKLLCYMIYMISCKIIKHRLWTSINLEEKNMQKIIPIVQKYIVHTCVDIINSILENSYQTGVSYIFEVFRVRFYSKLATTFQNDDYYNIILEQNKFKFASAKKRPHLKLIPIGENPPYTYNVSKMSIFTKFYSPYTKQKKYIINGITNLSNCENGKFHVWKLDSDNKLSCSLCKLKMTKLNFDAKITQTILNNYDKERSNNLAKRICKTGTNHYYIYDTKTEKKKCVNCNNFEDNNYTIEEIKNIDLIIEKINKERRQKHESTIKEFNDYESLNNKYISSVIQKLKKEMEDTKNYMFINIFIDEIKKILGDNIKGINIDDDFQLKLNTYIIDHNHYGDNLENNIVINDDDNKIFYKSSHPHFKIDVLYYTNRENISVDVFYDTITKKLLGYKEQSKDYVNIENSNKRLKINYSLYNKLKLMGYVGEYISIEKDHSNIKNKYINIDINEHNQNMYREIVLDISRERISNLKKTILEFHRVFYRIINNYSYNNESPEKNEVNNYFSKNMNSLIEKYIKKIKNINIAQNDGKHKIFKHWKAVSRGIEVSDFENNYFNFNSDLISSHIVSDYDMQSKLLLYYLISEFTLLLKYNSENKLNTIICTFLVDFINKIFYRYNKEHLYINNDINRFMYILNSNGFLREAKDFVKYIEKNNELENKEDENTDETYEDMDSEIINEKLMDIDEENDALDVDMTNEDIEDGMESAMDIQYNIENQ